MSEKIVQPPSARAPAVEQPVSEPSPGSPGPGSPGLDNSSKDAIAGRLKQLYGGLVSEPMPDKFKSLLDQLAKSEKKS